MQERRTPASADRRDHAAYPLSEAARYLKVAPATLRAWVLGRSYPTVRGSRRFQPLIHPPASRPPVLSFWNLVEAHVLRSLRTEHGVPLREVRQALRYAEHRLGVHRLLLRRELCTDAGQVFLDRYGQLINLSESGQLAIRHVFEEHLRRVEWDTRRFPVRLYPFVSADLTASEGQPAGPSIAIDARIAFGRPVVLRRGITTRAIADRIDAGETVAELAADYRLEPAEIAQAVVYEHAA